MNTFFIENVKAFTFGVKLLHLISTKCLWFLGKLSFLLRSAI